MPKPSLPTARDERGRAYLNVLFEISARLKFIKSLKPLNMPSGLAREVCYLQLRHICELVTIGCLVIQADYKSSPSLTGEYNPRKVLRGLTKLYRNCFPRPATIGREGDLLDVRLRTSPEALTQQQLEQLWNKTGAYLHRLIISNFFRPENWTEGGIWPGIESYCAKIEALLNPHIVEMHKPHIIVCAALDADNGKPRLMFVDDESEQPSLIHYHGRGATLYWEDQG